MVRVADLHLPPGVKDQRAGRPRTTSPTLYKKLKAADVVVFGVPIWLGPHRSSLCQRVLERLDGSMERDRRHGPDALSRQDGRVSW